MRGGGTDDYQGMDDDDDDVRGNDNDDNITILTVDNIIIFSRTDMLATVIDLAVSDNRNIQTKEKEKT